MQEKEKKKQTFLKDFLPQYTYQLCFSGLCFDLELARTQQQRERGLMFRTGLGMWSGMLFVFEKPGRYAFWMKNTYIPLDILWLDEEFRIVHMQTAFPCGIENGLDEFTAYTKEKNDYKKEIPYSGDKNYKTNNSKIFFDQRCPSYIPGGFALYVLEINAGSAKAIGLTKGKKMVLQAKKSSY